MLQASPLRFGHVVVVGYLQDIRIVHAKHVAGVRYERMCVRVGTLSRQGTHVRHASGTLPCQCAHIVMCAQVCPLDLLVPSVELKFSLVPL